MFTVTSANLRNGSSWAVQIECALRAANYAVCWRVRRALSVDMYSYVSVAHDAVLLCMHVNVSIL